MDGNLTKMDDSGADGEIVARTIKKQYPDMIVIGHSTRPIKSADINCPKNESIFKFVETVTKA